MIWEFQSSKQVLFEKHLYERWFRIHTPAVFIIGRKCFNPVKKLKGKKFIFALSYSFLPAAKRHGQEKVWVGIVLLLLQTIVSLVCFSFIFAMCVGILGQHGTVPKLSRSLTCNFYLQIFTCKFYLFFKILKKIKIFENIWYFELVLSMH